MLVRPKDPVEKARVVGSVYHIQRGDCEQNYLGETGRSLKACFDQRRWPSSATSDVSRHLHAHTPPHSISLEDTNILTTDSRWFERGEGGLKK